MKKYFLYPLRGTLNLLIIILSTITAAVGVYIFSLFYWIIPIKKIRNGINKVLHQFPVYWIDVISLAFKMMPKKSLDFHGPDISNNKRPYLLICNHQSWIDIFVLSYALHRKTPTIKFFMKMELLWTLPFAGLAAYLLGYPFMKRHTASEIRKNPELRNKDIETTHKACQQFIEHSATVMNYAEGTRFTEEKRIAKNSPYQHLLKPKAAGIAIVINELKHHLGGIINATIAYQPSNVPFWQFCCGNFKKITCHYEVIPVTDNLIGDYMKDREFRKQIQAWINQLWEEKDKQLQDLKSR